MKIKKLALSFLLILFTFGFFNFAFADGLRASPFRIEETVQPGERITRFITITNVSEETKTFYGGVRDFVPRGEGGEATRRAETLNAILLNSESSQRCGCQRNQFSYAPPLKHLC